ncbi:hypothetical protein L4D13_15040 [Photobacterium profundum]|uniref:hypothetical protein n=1 Tax=Photobacterium profundum TaxID=74109 RepID=UPI003D0C0103
MSFKQFMQSRQRNQFQAVGEFIFIEACSSEVLIQTERGEYRLRQGAQVIDPQLSGHVSVENLGEAGTVNIRCGFGRYIPPTDGESVTVSHIPAIKIAENQQVIVSQLPAVQLDASQVIPVKIADGQQVEVSVMPKMKLESGQAVRVYATTALLTKPVGGSSVSGSTLTIVSGGIVLEENTLRCHVLIKANKANQATVSLDGYELDAGEKQKIETSGALTFNGTDGDTIQVLEVLK